MVARALKLIEHGALDGACEAWLADPADHDKKLLCGKQMFFDEGMGTIGVPTANLPLLPGPMALRGVYAVLTRLAGEPTRD